MTSYESDILSKDLDVVFCGINPALSAAIDGHNFSHPSNRFWTVLYLAGFTKTRLLPQEERSVLNFRCGITALVSRPTVSANEISVGEFSQARAGFEAKMLHYSPRSIAFLGKRGLSNMIGQRDVSWGRHPSTIAGAIVWVLPNPSGLNRNFTLDMLVKAYSEFHKAILLEQQTASLVKNK